MEVYSSRQLSEFSLILTLDLGSLESVMEYAIHFSRK